MSTAIVFPRLGEMTDGFRASVALLRLQLGWGRSLKPRLIGLIMILVIAVVVAIVSYTGNMVKFAAIEQTGVIQVYAKNYLSAFARGELGGIGASALGFSILSALISPLTGATSTSFLPPRELAGVSITRWHRFTDSLFSQVLSSIAILQLITLTALSSMLTLDTPRHAGMFMTWFVWADLVSLTVLSLWVTEYLHRRFGSRVRVLIFSGVFAVVGVAILLDPQNGSTVFGIGTAYANTVAHIGDMSLWGQLGVYSTLTAGGLALLYVAVVVMSSALILPEAATKKSSSGSGVAGGRFYLKMSTDLLIFLRTIKRTPEIRKPIFASVVLGIILTMFAPQSFAVNSTFAVIIPLVVALAWGSNAFSHLGGGATWMLSQPRSLARAPWMIFGIQVTMSLVLFTVVWTPSVIFGRNSIGDFLTNLIAVAASGVIVARSATSKSLKKAEPTHYGSRGESTLSPMRALQYTMRFALWGGQFGVIILSLEDTKVRVSLLFLAVLYQAVRMRRLQDFWGRTENRRTVAAAVAND